MGVAAAENAVTQQTTVAAEVVISNEPVELTQASAKETIVKFANLKNEAGARQLFATLSTAVIQLQDMTIGVEVHNEAQREKLNEIKQDMLDFIRKDLSNNGVLIDIRVMQHHQETKAYKPTDKFKMLAEKNPALLELKKRFDLEIEY